MTIETHPLIDWSRIRRERRFMLKVELRGRNDAGVATVTAADVAAMGAFLQAMATVMAQDPPAAAPDPNGDPLTHTRLLAASVVGPAFIEIRVEHVFNWEDYSAQAHRVIVVEPPKEGGG